MSWLKGEEWNIPFMLVTPEVSHPPMSWLKADFLNMETMSVAPEVSHAPMFSLKDAAAEL